MNAYTAIYNVQNKTAGATIVPDTDFDKVESYLAASKIEYFDIAWSDILFLQWHNLLEKTAEAKFHIKPPTWFIFGNTFEFSNHPLIERLANGGEAVEHVERGWVRRSYTPKPNAFKIILLHGTTYGQYLSAFWGSHNLDYKRQIRSRKISETVLLSDCHQRGSSFS